MPLIDSFMRGSHESVLTSLQFVLEYYEMIKGHQVSIVDLITGINHYIRSQSAMDLLRLIESTHIDGLGPEGFVIQNEISS